MNQDLVARLRFMSHERGVDGITSPLLREAADALDSMRTAIAESAKTIGALGLRATAAEARAEKAERVVEAARSIVGAHDSEDFLDARGTIEAALDRYGGSVATGRRVIAENAAVLERLGTSGDQTVPPQAAAGSIAEATRLAQSHNLMHKSENPGDRVVGIDAVDGVTPRTLNDVFGLNDPDFWKPGEPDRDNPQTLAEMAEEIQRYPKIDPPDRTLQKQEEKEK